MAEHFKIPPEKVRCEGCQVLTPKCWGYNCKIVQCLKAKGLDYCFECPEYETKSCENFEKMAKAYLEKYSVSLRANLSMIKAGKTEKWLKEYDESFKCPFCGKPLSVSAVKKECYHCGAKLD